MATGYKFMIKEGEGFQFILYPNNNNHQPIGSSKSYRTLQECINAFNSFRNIIKTCDANSLLVVEEAQINKFYPSIVYEGEALFSRTIAYAVNKQQCNQWVSLIQDNIDAPLR